MEVKDQLDESGLATDAGPKVTTGLVSRGGDRTSVGSMGTRNEKSDNPEYFDIVTSVTYD